MQTQQNENNLKKEQSFDFKFSLDFFFFFPTSVWTGAKNENAKKTKRQKFAQMAWNSRKHVK